MERYAAYGLELRSDLALPELLAGTPGCAATVAIGAMEARPGEPLANEPHCEITAEAVRLGIPAVGQFHVHGGERIAYRRARGVSDDVLRAYLLGSGLGSILIQRGMTVLHGNAVEIDGGCLVCVGESGVGKSTTVAGFLRRGYRVIADDVCPLDLQGRVIPGMPHIKIMQETADALGIATAGLPRFATSATKFRLPLGDAFAATPTPLRMVVELCAHDASGVAVEPVTGGEKLAMLMRNLYRPAFVWGMERQAQVFDHLGRRMTGIRAFRVHRPRSGFHLEALLDTLFDVYSLSASKAGTSLR